MCFSSYLCIHVCRWSISSTCISYLFYKTDGSFLLRIGFNLFVSIDITISLYLQWKKIQKKRLFCVLKKAVLRSMISIIFQQQVLGRRAGWAAEEYIFLYHQQFRRFNLLLIVIYENNHFVLFTKPLYFVFNIANLLSWRKSLYYWEDVRHWTN